MEDLQENKQVDCGGSIVVNGNKFTEPSDSATRSQTENIERTVGDENVKGNEQLDSSKQAQVSMENETELGNKGRKSDLFILRENRQEIWGKITEMRDSLKVLMKQIGNEDSVRKEANNLDKLTEKLQESHEAYVGVINGEKERALADN